MVEEAKAFLHQLSEIVTVLSKIINYIDNLINPVDSPGQHP